jgi:hypothetical protein
MRRIITGVFMLACLITILVVTLLWRADKLERNQTSLKYSLNQQSLALSLNVRFDSLDLGVDDARLYCGAVFHLCFAMAENRLRKNDVSLLRAMLRLWHFVLIKESITLKLIYTYVYKKEELCK